jgi:hypothetical protein
MSSVQTQTENQPTFWDKVTQDRTLNEAFTLAITDIMGLLNEEKPIEGVDRAHMVQRIHCIVLGKTRQLKEWTFEGPYKEGAKAVLDAIMALWTKASKEWGFGLSCKEKVKGSGVYWLKVWDAENGEGNSTESVISD